MRSANYISRMVPYTGQKVVLVTDHDVDDIVNAILYKHHKHFTDYDRISPLFWRGNAKDTAQCIFDFLKKNVSYKVEKPTDQTVKSPGAIAAQKIGDCKHYALFTNGILHSLQRKGYNVGSPAFRFAGYHLMDNGLHHVFAVVKINGKEYWIDPVLSSFDNRKMYFVHKDKSVTDMPLSEISGVGDDFIGANIFDKIKHAIQVNAANVKHAVNVNAANAGKGLQQVQHAVQVNAANAGKGLQKVQHAVKVNASNAGKTVQQVKQTVLKVNPLSVTARNSFLALLKMNGFNIAHRLYDYIHSSTANQDKVYAKWRSLGGDPNKIKTAITDGMRAYAYRSKINLADYNKQRGFAVSGIYVFDPNMPHGTRRQLDRIAYNYPYFVGSLSDSRNSIGMEPATMAALMTAAAAVIAAFSQILKEAKWSDADRKNAQAATAAGAQILSNQAAHVNNGVIPTAFVPREDGGSMPVMEAQVTTTADGTKVIDVQQTDALIPDTQGGFTEQIHQMWDSLKGWVIEYKVPLMFATGGVLLYKSGILFNANKTKRRRY